MDKILLVEDDKNLSFITKRMLESRGYDIEAAFSIKEAENILDKKKFDLILLDMMLPDGDGTNLCEKIRQTSVCPIIFVSCLSDNMTKISALEAGGDDYIVKPVNYEELITRIQINIRRAKQYNILNSEVDELTYPGLFINKNTREVWITDDNDKPTELAELSPIEYALLICMTEHEGTLLLYQNLYHEVWKSEDLGDVRTVMVHVSNLRKKLGERGKNLIHTVRSAGYIFRQ